MAKQKFKKRLFILDSACSDDFLNMFRKIDKDRTLEIITSKEKGLNYLPGDYDAYLLHLLDTSEEAIEDLRKEQPWSLIYVIHRSGVGYIPYSISEIIDREFSTLIIPSYKRILSQIQNPRREKK